MSDPQEATPESSQQSHSSKPTLVDHAPAITDTKEQDKPPHNASSDTITTTMPPDLKYFLDFCDHVAKTSLSHANIATYPEEIRPKLTAVGEKVRKHIAAHRQVYDDLARDPSNQDAEQRRVRLRQEMASLIPETRAAAELFAKEAVRERFGGGAVG